MCMLYILYHICQRSYGLMVAMAIKADVEVARNSHGCCIAGILHMFMYVSGGMNRVVSSSS